MRSDRQFRDAAAVQRPAVIAVIQRDDDAAMRPVQPFHADHGIYDALQIVALGRVLQALFVRVAPRFRETHVPDDFSVVAELRARAVALAFDGFRVASATERIDKIAENLFGLCGALLRHHGVRILRGSSRCKHRTGEQT